MVSIHEEASVIPWQRTVTVPPEAEARLVVAVTDLHTWSLGLGASAEQAAKRATEVGRGLRNLFIGDEGLAVVKMDARPREPPPRHKLTAVPLRELLKCPF